MDNLESVKGGEHKYTLYLLLFLIEHKEMKLWDPK